jgi:hypothetical protein
VDIDARKVLHTAIIPSIIRVRSDSSPNRARLFDAKATANCANGS